MKASGDISVSTDKRSLRFALLALSTIIILGASTYAYARVSYQTPLSVSGSNTGTGSTSAISFSPLLMIIPVVLGVLISLSLFLTLRHASKNPRQANIIARPTREAFPSPPLLESGTPSNTASTQPEESSIESRGNKGLDAIDRILHSIRKKEEEAGENTGSSSTGSSQ